MAQEEKLLEPAKNEIKQLDVCFRVTEDAEEGFVVPASPTYNLYQETYQTSILS